MRLFFLFVVLYGFLSGNALCKEQLVLAENGKANAIILTDAKVTPIQKQAINELGLYLNKVTKATFQAYASRPKNYEGVVIRVGIAKEVDGERIPSPRGWAVVTIDNELKLLGSDDFGVVMAVYGFLEDVIGIHWFTPWSESVPSIDRLVIHNVHDIGQPVFIYGHEMGLSGGGYLGIWAFRNRLSCRYLGEENKKQTRIGPAYGPPYNCHSLAYLVPMDIRKKHMSWVALRNSKRNPANRGLCLTNPELRDYTIAELKKTIRSYSEKQKKSQYPLPFFYYIGADDGAAWCQCPACRAITKKNSSHSGNMLTFVNSCARAIDPQTLLATLAYQSSRKVPSKTRPEKNVMVVWCPEKLNQTRSLTDPVNKTSRSEFDGWARKCENLGVFYYATTFGYGEALGGGYGTGFPAATLNSFVDNIRYFQKNNVKYIFLDCRPDIFRHMPDLIYWIYARMLLRTDRNLREELVTFTDGYYGPAGKHVMAYLDLLEEASQKTLGNIWFYAELSDYKYLDFAFLVKADTIWDKAQKAVENNPELSQRVRCGRLSVDRAILALWPQLIQELLAKGEKIETMPIDRNRVFYRYVKTMNEQKVLRCDDVTESCYKRCWKRWRDEITAFKRNRYIPASKNKLPVKVSATKVFDYPAGAINYRISGDIKLVKDSTADCGYAWKISRFSEVKHQKQVYDPNIGYQESEEKRKFKSIWNWPIVWGHQLKFRGAMKPDKRKISEGQLSSSYKWFLLGEVHLLGNSHIYIFESRALKINFFQTGLFDVWVHLKLVNQTIYLDRLILVEKNEPENG